MIKVLVVTAEPPGPPLNGLGRYVQEFKEAAQGHLEVKALSLQLDPHFPIVDEKKEIKPEVLGWADWAFRVEHDWYADAPEGRMWVASHGAFLFVQPVLKEFQPDIVYLQSVKVWLPFRYEKNVVLALHGLSEAIAGKKPMDAYGSATRRLEQEALERAIGVVVFSDWMKKQLEANYTNSNGLSVLPFGIKAQDLQSTVKPNHALNVAYFGRLEDDEKGCLAFFQAAQELFEAETFPDVVFHVYGEGEEKKETLYPGLRFHGHLTGESLLQAYQATHVVVMPSRQEPFGLVGLEAMATGCLLLCPRGLGMDAYVRFGENAVEIEATPDSIQRVLEQVLRHFESYQGLMKAGVETATAWDWQNSLPSHVTFFEEIKFRLV